MIKRKNKFINKKALFLFEVAFVVLIVSVLSLFIIRGYGIFIKVAKKSFDYTNILYFIDNKICQLSIQEEKGEISEDLEKEGVFGDSRAWSLEMQDTDYQGLTRVRLNILQGNKSQSNFDLVVYLNKKEQKFEKEE